MSRKNRPSSQANQLRDMGVPALGTMDKNGKYNPIAFYNVDRSKYKQLWTHYDITQYCSFINWKELPQGLTSWNLNRMLYFRTALMGFNYGGKSYVMPFVNEGGLNCYGLPVKGSPIWYSDGIDKDEKIKYFQGNLSFPIWHGDGLPDKDPHKYGYILYDSVPYAPASKPVSRYALNQIIIAEIADALARININIVVSNKKIFLIIKDATQRDIVETELHSAFGNDSPFATITSPLEVQTVQDTNDYNADDLFNTVRNWDSIRCFMQGIDSKNFGTEKKERLVSGELAGNETQIQLVGDMRFYFCDKWAKQMNGAFGENIVVEKRVEAYKDMQDGRGMTKLEEEQNL